MKYSELKKVLINKYDWVKNHTWFNDKVLINEIISAVEENSKTEIEQLSKDYELEMKRHYTTIQELKATIEEKNKIINDRDESLVRLNKKYQESIININNLNAKLNIAYSNAAIKNQTLDSIVKVNAKLQSEIDGLNSEIKELKALAHLSNSMTDGQYRADQKEIDILKHSLKSCENALNEERLRSSIFKTDTFNTIKELQAINNQLQSRLTYLERNSEGYSVPPFLPISIQVKTDWANESFKQKATHSHHHTTLESRVKKLEEKVFTRTEQRIELLKRNGFTASKLCYQRGPMIISNKGIVEIDEIIWNDFINRNNYTK